MKDGERSAQGQSEGISTNNDNFIDLANLDDTWNRLYISDRQKFTLWGTVDRWGPGALSILTLLIVALILWLYSVKLAAIETELRQAKEKNSELAQKLYVKELKDQQLRESLLKKGLID